MSSENEDSSDYSDIEQEQEHTPITDAQLSSLDEIALTTKKAIAVEKKKVLGPTKKPSDGKKKAYVAVPTVVYVGHIPFGFFEKQMKKFFSQFGDIERLVLARNNKTGASRHYGFIEFKHEYTARVVVQSMHQYMMFGRTLQVSIVPAEKVHKDMFAFRKKPTTTHQRAQAARVQANRVRTEEEQEQRIANIHDRDASRNAKLKALGIDYKFKTYPATKKKRKKPDTTKDSVAVEEKVETKKVTKKAKTATKKRSTRSSKKK